jgi:erythronate-4-phosphate dehydrogenase
MRAGIIGAGHTGRAAEQLLTRLSVRCVRYDPPKAEIEPGFQSSTLDEVLDCDILTFHTPLTNTGPWPTYHWLDSDKLKSRTYQLIINASRGGVVDEQALLNSYQKDKVRSFVLDVWENEPVFSDRTAEAAFLSTPHIAGYSIQAKQKATRMVMQSLCEFFNISAKEFDFTPPAPSVPEVSEELTNRGLTGLLSELNPIREYHRLFSRLHGLTPGQKQRGFQQIRTEFPLRHEHSCFKISKEIMGRHPVLHSLGFGMKKN